MNLWLLKIRKMNGKYFPKNTWEVRKTGKNWNIRLGKELFRQIYHCLRRKK